MASKAKFLQIWNRLLLKYEKYSYARVKSVINAWGQSIPYDELTPENYRGLIAKAIDGQLMVDAYKEIYLTVGLRHGAVVGREVNANTKNFILTSFKELFPELLSLFFQKYITSRIVTVEQSYFDEIAKIISQFGDKTNDLEWSTKEIKKIVTNPKFYKWQAERIARTEANTAANYSTFVAGDSTDFVMEKVWMSHQDKRTRTSPPDDYDHAEMDGKRIPYNETFDFNMGTGEQDELLYPCDPTGEAANVINCYLPGNFIESNIIEGTKSFYTGQAIEIITRRGESISVTPNHSILTTNGFVPAKDIKIGNNLICNKVNTNPIFRLVNNYIKKKLFTVENVFSTLNKFWCSKEVMVTALDFDTDGESINGNINIIYPEIKLRNSFVSTIIKYFNKLKLKSSNSKGVFVAGFSFSNFFGSRNKSTFSRFVSFLYLSFPLCFRHFRPLKTFRFGLASKLNSKRFKSPSQSDSDDARFLRELIETDAALISFDDVVDVRYFEFSGHIYDFSSVNGVNIVNNIYTSNCRCTIAVVPKLDINGAYLYKDEINTPLNPSYNG